MDTGIFMISGRRLKTWLVLPPLLMVGMGLGSYAWRQQAEWHLQESKALFEVFPSFMAARNNALELVKGFEASSDGVLGSKEQLISFLQDMAQKNGFTVDSINVLEREKRQTKNVPVLYAGVAGKGNFKAIQSYINSVKIEQRLFSVNSIKIAKPDEFSAGDVYNVEIIFELLLLDEIKLYNGGVP